ncbi:hypothetical protein EZV62_002493 [Acer yangbiense]|uniref:Uncharacterized protein n=1 Tax=Acer yangbiense TaxID=1000413 RepID=A0A5C7IYF3_9ROSI|nr:hypothetical protein EZV62_002493 [Acer yangbiense]
MATTVVNNADPADDLQLLLAEQRAELTAAQSLESDLDFAFRLHAFDFSIIGTVALYVDVQSPSRDGCDHVVMRLTFKMALQITGRWPPKQRKIAVLVNQVHLLRCNPVLVARNETCMRCINSHMMEICVICLEDNDVGNTFSVDGCLRRYCFSCMKLQVENKLLHAMVPKCLNLKSTAA